jgi:hypothetical protein
VTSSRAVVVQRVESRTEVDFSRGWKDIDIAGQLDGGIRAFDIRVMRADGAHVMHHAGITSPGEELGTALDQFAAFASAHPTGRA